MEEAKEREPEQLRREVGLFGLTVYGVGSILGAGIYALIGAAAGLAGYGLWLAFLNSGLIALLTGLSYAELSSIFPRAGAEYHYVRNGFGSTRLGFLTGWALIVGAAGAAATVAVGFAGYLEQLTDIPRTLSAFALIGVLSAVNFLGIRHSTALNVGLTAIEVGGLVLVIFLGLTRGPLAFVPALPGDFAGVISAAALLFFSYLGFEHIANIAEEARNPQDILPKALMGAIGISALLYVLVALASVALVQPEVLAASHAPIAMVASQVLGPLGGTVLSIIALFATANTVLLVLVASSRLVFGMARDGALPMALTDINPSTRTPGSAIIFLMVLSWAILPLGDLRLIGSLSSFSALVAFTLVNLALLRLRYVRPDLPRPFRSPVNVGRFPVLAALGALSAIGAGLLLDRNVILIGTGILVAGLLASYVLPARGLRRG